MCKVFFTSVAFSGSKMPNIVELVIFSLVNVTSFTQRMLSVHLLVLDVSPGLYS